jgi:hypothetical protein
MSVTVTFHAHAAAAGTPPCDVLAPCVEREIAAARLKRARDRPMLHAMYDPRTALMRLLDGEVPSNGVRRWFTILVPPRPPAPREGMITARLPRLR